MVTGGTKTREAMANRYAIAVASLWLVLGGAGCASFGGNPLSAEQQAVYESQLDERVQGYVYKMDCDALMPMAEQLLWDRGYRDLDYESGELVTEWGVEDGASRVKYSVYAHQAGSQQCAVQFMRRKKGGQTPQQQRDIERELELIEYIDDDEARRIRDEARQKAEDGAP